MNLHVREVMKRDHHIKLGSEEHFTPNLNDEKHKVSFFEEMKIYNYNDLEDMVYAMNLTYNEVLYLLDI